MTGDRQQKLTNKFSAVTVDVNWDLLDSLVFSWVDLELSVERHVQQADL